MMTICCRTSCRWTAAVELQTRNVTFCFLQQYLLAMTFVYIKRANFPNNEHMRLRIFAALYLAHMVEEEEEGPRYEILPWALGIYWREIYPSFFKYKDELWRQMGFRALVSRPCCEQLFLWLLTEWLFWQVMAVAPSHYIWQRERPACHSGARRRYTWVPPQPRGPGYPPLPCSICGKKGRSVRLGGSSSSSSSDSTLRVTKLC
ncbi:hypothetical protein ASZ78_011283, partial [Callipepla squamata]